MLDIKNKNICIVSYIHECGLFYLAKYFYKSLVRDNNIVWIPKIKYSKMNGRFVPTVLTPKKELINKNIKIIDIDYYSNFLQKNDFDIILSFETNFIDSWTKDNYNKIVDIPMVEWLDPKYLFNYSMLKDVICLNEYSFETMKRYCSPKFVKFSINKKQIYDKEKGLFYHQATLNEDYSSKNTASVIRAFRNTENNLIITGILSKSEKDMLTNNITHLGVIDKLGVNELYKKADYLVAPSESEGLGLHIYEAKSYGCKVITSSYPTISNLGDEVISLDGDIEKQIFSFLKKYNKNK